MAESNVNSTKPSFKDSINKNFTGANALTSAANTAFTAIAGERSEFSGKEGALAKSLDSTYDTIQDAVSLLGPYGKAASLAMGVGKLVGNIAGKLGGGTDGMTKLDSILGSPFFLLSPFGLINGFGGKKSDTFAKDNELFSTMGSSYGGASDMADDALAVSGKKYGAFSSGALSEANQAIAEALRQQTMISRINTEAQNRQALQSSMAGTNYNGYSLAMQGGYDQSGVRVGRFGMVFEKNIQRAKNILKAQKGALFYNEFLSNPLDPDAEFQAYLKSLPEYLRGDENYRVRDYWEFNGRPKDFLEAILRGMFAIDLGDGHWHAKSVSENPKTGEIEFMKSSKHPNHSFEVDWYNSDEAKDFRKEYKLVKSEPYWKYVKRKTPLKEETLKLQEGGNIGSIIKPIKPIFKTEEPVVQEFKEGGSFNVIPEGALHARKHNMDIEGITSKGIPVVSQAEGGEIEQQAEIERNEVILRLEVTKKLEELLEKYYSDDYTQKQKDEFAIEAGKLLTYELLQNTLDNTGLLNEV